MATFPPSPTPSSPLTYPPSHTALLLADYQTLIISTLGPPGLSTLPIATSLRAWARSHNILTIHCTIDLTTPPPATSRAADRIKAMQEKVAAQPELGEIHRDLAPAAFDEGEMTLSRQAGRISALHSAGIREVLEKRGIKSVIIAGLSSSGVVLSTVRQMADEGFVVTVVEDGCADRTREVHRVVMEAGVGGVAFVERGEVVMGGLEGGWKEERGKGEGEGGS